MKKNRGFTLVELLAVIVILAIILVIAVPNISSIIANVQVSAFRSNEQLLLKVAKTYVGINDSYLPVNVGDSKEITLDTLETNNYISEIISPTDKSKTCNGYVLIKKIGQNNYEYTPILNCINNIGSSVDDALVAYYKLDGNALDYSLNNNDGTIYGTTATTDRFGNANKALNFDGTDDAIRTARVIQDDFSIKLWIKSTSGGTGTVNWYYGNGLVDSEVSGVENDFGLSYQENGEIAAGVGDPDTTIISPLHLNDGIWHCVVFTRLKSSGAINLYVDGNLISKTTGTNTQSLTSATYTDIGRIQTGINYYNGSIDDVKIYARVLSPEEIKQAYLMKE